MVISKATKALLEREIRAFRNRRILVVGDVMLDLYIEGPPRFVSQEAPVVVVGVTRKTFKLGGAANAAENIRMLGGRPTLIGVIGNHLRHDDVGRSFFAAYRASGLDRRGLIIDPGRPTTVKTRVLSHGQHLLRIDEESTAPIRGSTERRVIAAVTAALPRVDAVLISDYNKGVITSRLMRITVRLARAQKKKVLVDPRPQHRNLYRDIAAITPNETELSHMFGATIVEEGRLRALARRLLYDNAIEAVILTRGAKGMDVVTPKGAPTHIPALARHVVDVSGAGDTVAAVMAMAAVDLEWSSAALLASIAARVVIEKPGTATVTGRELHRALRAL